MRVFLLLATILLGFNASAVEFDGYIVDLRDDTTYCKIYFDHETIYMENGELISSEKLEIVTERGGKRSYYMNRLKSFSVQIEEDWKHYHTIKAGNALGSQFAKREVQGRLSLYTFYTYDNLNDSYQFHQVLDRETRRGSETLVAAGSGLKRRLSDYFSDCEELSQAISKKQIKLKNREAWAEMVNRYNSTCGLEE